MELPEKAVFRHDTLPKEYLRIFQRMKQNKEFCDVNVHFGDCAISAHRIVLYAAFPRLKEVFGNRVQSNTEKFGELEVEPSALEALVNYAYSSELEITNDNVEELLSAAQHLKNDEVLDACCSFFNKGMTPQNVLRKLKFAERVPIPALIECCYQFIKKNFDQVSATKEFLFLPLSCIKQLISTDDLVTSGEENVLEVVMKWTKHSPERKDDLPELLRYVRLALVNHDCIKDCIARDEDIRTSVACRDLFDEANYYHLLPERRNELSSMIARPRKRLCLRPGYDNVQSRTSFGGDIYAVSKHISLTVQHLDWSRNEWKTLKTVPFEVGTGTVACTADEIFFVDNECLKSCDIHSPTWKGNSKFISSRSYASAAVLNNALYVCGGTDGRRCLNDVLCFDLEKNVNVLVPPMFEIRLFCGVVALGGYLYVFGGHTGRHYTLQSVERYSPRSQTWIHLTPMKMHRFGMGCAVHNGKIYVCGGKNSSNTGSETLNSAEVYDPVTSEWNDISPMRIRRFQCSLVSDGACLYAIGGDCNEDGKLPNTVEIYEPESGEWKFGPSMDPTKKYVRAVSVG